MADQPNILLIVSDQHSNQVMGCAGDDVVRTPNLDALATRGTIFEHAHCAAPLCVPSRMTMLTGRHCSDIGVWTNSCYLGSDLPTFAHALGAAGYETVLCGRMHFIGPDQRHGFERRIIGDVAPYGPGGGRGARLGERMAGASRQTYPAVAVSGAGRTAYQAYDEAVGAVAREFLATRADERPLLMVAGFVLPHCPFVARRDLFEYYYERVAMPEIPDGYFERLHPAMRYWREVRGVTELTDEQVRSARAGYYGLINHVDDQLRRLLNPVIGIGRDLQRDTIVVFTSDHGEMLGDHHLWRKSRAYEPAARVPFLVQAPREFGLRPGSTVDAPCTHADIMPTLLEMAGIDVPGTCDGRSLLPLMRGEDVAWREYVHIEHVPEHMGLTDGLTKYIWDPKDGSEQLFDLVADPNECHDLSADPDHADRRALWRGRLIDELRDRPEGFVQDGRLVAGREWRSFIPGKEDRSP